MKHAAIGLVISALLLFQTSGNVERDDLVSVALREPVAMVTVDQGHIIEYQVLNRQGPDVPVMNVNTVFEFTHVESGSQLRVTGVVTEDPLVNLVVISLDRPGEWTWMAILLNFRDTPSAVTILPPLFSIAPGANALTAETILATPIPSGPGHITIEDDLITPWRLEVSLGLKVVFENESRYPVSVYVEDGGSFDEVNRLEPGSSVMWYSTTPGDYLFTVGPDPAFRVGQITVTGEP